MNLQENINRIKEVMGIINESNLDSFKRRMGELPKYIKSTYQWLAPKMFKDFEEFVERVIFSTTRDFVAFELNINDYDEMDKIREEVLPYIKDFIINNYLEEIRQYYISDK